jgi:hypothetical protein
MNTVGMVVGTVVGSVVRFIVGMIVGIEVGIVVRVVVGIVVDIVVIGVEVCVESILTEAVQVPELITSIRYEPAVGIVIELEPGCGPAEVEPIVCPALSFTYTPVT